MPISSSVNTPNRLLPNLLAILYALGGYGAGWALLFLGSFPEQILGALLLGHSMVISAYLLHEAVHNAIFKDPARNLNLARFLNWLTGTPYNSAADIREKHLRHHFDVADVVAFDPYDFMSRHRVWVRFLKFFEWFYIPMAEIWMHGMMLALPFIREEKKA